MKELREYKFIIKRREDDTTRWQVVPSPGNPAQKPTPGAVLMWEFDQDAYYRGLEAHFQFCHSVTERGEEVCFIASEQLNRDWAGSIPDHVGSQFITGTLRPGVPPNKELHYAVWVVDPKGIDDFAIGENPPPKIETGGGG